MNFLKNLLRRRHMESEMDAELRFHIDSFTADLIRQGVPREQAERRSRMEFGGIEAKKEECRESLGFRLWDQLRGDIPYAFRMMKQNRGFTAVAVISLSASVQIPRSSLSRGQSSSIRWLSPMATDCASSTGFRPRT